MSTLSDIAFRAVLERVEAGTTTADDARWLRMYVRELQARVNAWNRWEHDWVFGGNAPWPGLSGVTDPRETLDEMIRIAFGYPCDSVADMQSEIAGLRTECEFWREQTRKRDEEMGRLSGRLLQFEHWAFGEGVMPEPPDWALEDPDDRE